MNYSLMEDVSLKKYNTLRLKTIAKLMVFPFNLKGIREIFVKFGEKKIIVLGNGSNILLSREYYGDDFLFLNTKLMDDIFIENNKLYAQSGLSLRDLAWYATEKNIEGFEFLEDIPGTVGGAVIMNAGTHEGNIGRLIKKVIYFDIDKNQIVEKEVTEEDFDIRTSIWDNNRAIILGCYFELNYGDSITSLNKILELKKKRFKKHPRNYSSAGSVFKRREKNEAFVWELIDKVGLRGYKKNGAMISDKHPNFIVNIGNATYDDLKYLIDLCEEKVFNEFNVKLELEWKII